MVAIVRCAALLAGVFLLTASPVADAQTGTPKTAAPESSGQWGRDDGGAASACQAGVLGSPYIPVDSWVYPAVLRLYSMGFLDHVFLGVHPWTRASLSHMLADTGSMIESAAEGPVKDNARDLYAALNRELHPQEEDACAKSLGNIHVESIYSQSLAVTGTPLRDSFHLGSTIVNNYGRPYENGLNGYSGASGYLTSGRFALYLRGEFQAASSASGYSPALFQKLATIDLTVSPVNGVAFPNQATIPLGPIATTTQGRFLEAYVSAQVLNHVISFGKQDEWLGPAQGASMAYSNNAENIYAFHINRIEPLYVPFLSRFTGPFRYEFLVGPLRGHTLMPNPLYASDPVHQGNVISPGNPWVHIEKISFRPTDNLEFGFERTVLWAGKGHSPANLHMFLKSFFSLVSPSAIVKNGPEDPGARFGAFDAAYRLPFVRKWLTLYVDSEAHDDVSPVDAPRRASWRPGLFLSHVPGIPALDIRAEGISTDPPVSRSNGGLFVYWEQLERQGYTNQGQLFGDWIGREDKGGQGWITCHLSGNEWIQASLRTQKAARDFIPGGTTLNDIGFQVVKRIGKNYEINGGFVLEHWKIPVYLAAPQTVTATTVQLTWFPKRTVHF
jgi:hypothetical protein